MKSFLQKVISLVGIEEAPRTRRSIEQKNRQVEKRQQTRRFLQTACYFCKRTNADFTSFYDDNSQHIHVCPLCLEYADRRAYKKR